MNVPSGDVPSLEPAVSVAGGWRQVHLVGFMGAGKSTVGRRLARRLLWNFLDLDALIERYAGRPVSEIFKADGEAGFRDMERHVFRQAVLKPLTVVALGGGTFVDRANVAVSRRHGVSVWLRCSPEVVAERLGPASGSRPLWDPATAAVRMQERRPAYELADLVVDADAEPEAVATRLSRLLASAEVRPGDAGAS